MKRYTMNIGPGEPRMVENIYGAWVQWEDAAELREQMLKLAAGFMDPSNHKLFCEVVDAME